MGEKLSVLFVTAEADPYATRAGLAQVAGSLPQAIKSLGGPELAVDVRVILPKYSNEELRALEEEQPFHTVISRCRVPFGDEMRDVAVQRDDRYGVTTYFVDSDEFFGCDARIYWPPEILGPDCATEAPNIRRFAFFSRAVLEVIRRLRFRPDVIHCHDWHTALIPAYLWTLYGNDPFFREPGRHCTGSVFTLHNVGRGFQGIWPLDRKHKPDVLELAGLDAYKVLYDPFRGLTHAARPEEGVTEINLLKGGIVFADRANTVSPTYAAEMLKYPVITGSEGWCDVAFDYRDNLITFLEFHRSRLSGIVNGIDYTYRDGEQPKGWDPAQDTCLVRNYTAADLDVVRERIPHKDECKRALQRKLGLPEDETIPLIGMIGRLEPQKGLALLLEDFSRGDVGRFGRLGIQLFICGRPGAGRDGQLIGEGLARYARLFPDWLRVDMSFVPEALVHQLFAGCDMILMPSEYEPCGMPQMQGHRYGAIAIVRKAGGLADTVADGVDGFVFEAEPWGSDRDKIQDACERMLGAIERAVQAYREGGAGWGSLIRNSMQRDHSWMTPAREYLKLYRQAQQDARTRQPYVVKERSLED